MLLKLRSALKQKKYITSNKKITKTQCIYINKNVRADYTTEKKK